MLIYYLILGLETDASDEEIRARYLDLVKLYPPETGAEAFKMITVAYEAVKDKRSRIKTKIFGTSELAEYNDIIKALTLSLPVTKRSPLLNEIIKAENKG